MPPKKQARSKRFDRATAFLWKKLQEERKAAIVYNGLVKERLGRVRMNMQKVSAAIPTGGILKQSRVPKRGVASGGSAELWMDTIRRTSSGPNRFKRARKTYLKILKQNRAK